MMIWARAQRTSALLPVSFRGRTPAPLPTIETNGESLIGANHIDGTHNPRPALDAAMSISLHFIAAGAAPLRPNVSGDNSPMNQNDAFELARSLLRPTGALGYLVTRGPAWPPLDKCGEYKRAVGRVMGNAYCLLSAYLGRASQFGSRFCHKYGPTEISRSAPSARNRPIGAAPLP